MLTTSVCSQPDDFLSRLHKIMRDPEIVKFFQMYFSTWSDTRASLMLMNVYLLVEEEFEQSVGRKPKGTDVASVVRQLMIDASYRRMIVDSFNEYTTNIHTNFHQNIRSLIADNKLSIEK